jgi:hypothetical protein
MCIIMVSVARWTTSTPSRAKAAPITAPMLLPTIHIRQQSSAFQDRQHPDVGQSARSAPAQRQYERQVVAHGCSFDGIG